MTSDASRNQASLFSLTSLVVANMVGTGIFTSLGFQVKDLHSGFSLMMLWIAGGLCAFCGALCYAELSAAIPRSGGEYHFLSRIYGRPVGFVAGWISATAGFAAPVAIAAIALGSYLHGLNPAISVKLIAVIVILAMTVLHLLGPNIGLQTQNALTILKVLIISILLIAALRFPTPQAIVYLPSQGDMSLLLSRPFAVSLVFVMYAYSGWNAATYIISEAKDPQRNVPRALFTGTAIVMLLYVGLTWAFLRSTPMAKLEGQVEVGLIAARGLLGQRLGGWMGLAIALLLISSISAMVRIGPRVNLVMGQDHPALGFLAKVRTDGTPVLAILFQCVISLVMLLTGTFDQVLVYAQFLLLLCTFLVALGVILLRIREPELPRPYRVWGYPVTPAIFLIITLWMMIFVTLGRPLATGVGILIVVIGLALYYVSSRMNPSPLTDAQP
jgi:basic amino acid/polyamine antiporter, APA family